MSDPTATSKRSNFGFIILAIVVVLSTTLTIIFWLVISEERYAMSEHHKIMDAEPEESTEAPPVVLTPHFREVSEVHSETTKSLQPVAKQSEAIEDQPATNPFASDENDALWERQAKQLAVQIRDAQPDQKVSIRKQLERITEQQFEYRQQRRQVEFESLNQRVTELIKSHTRRQANKAEIIQRRVNELIDPSDDLNWDRTEITKATTTGSPPAANSKPELPSTTKLATESTNAATKPQTKNGSEPTYNGMTLGQILERATTERSPQKVKELVLGMCLLADQGDSRELARAIMQLMRFHGAEFFEKETAVIMYGAILVLTQLPENVVVEELISELPATISRKPTRSFINFFLACLSQKNMGLKDAGSVLLEFRTSEVDAQKSRWQEEFNRLIRLNSRTLISQIVDIANKNDDLLVWSLRTATQIVRLSNQPITTYPTLIPIAERALSLNDKTRSIQNFDHRLEAAKLLGGAGLRISECLTFAEQRLDDFKQMNNNSWGVNQALECLVEISPHCPQAIVRLNQLLLKDWDQSIDFAQVTENRVIEFSKTQFAIDSCNSLIKKVTEIGILAKVSIPLLRSIADFKYQDAPQPPKIQDELTTKWVTSLNKVREKAAAAIELIENAKPKPPPEPLPESETPVSTIAPRTTSGPELIAGPTSKEESTPKEELTYDGIAYSQWLKLLETERKPDKLIAAIEACCRLAAKGDERRTARGVFRAASTFETGDTDLESSFQAVGLSGLRRLPSDVVVEELIVALRDRTTYQKCRSFQVVFLLEPFEKNSAFAEAIRTRAKDIIAELVNLTPPDSTEDDSHLLAAASEVALGSKRPLTDFAGLSQRLNSMISTGFFRANQKAFFYWVKAVLNTAQIVPETPDLAITLVNHAIKCAKTEEVVSKSLPRFDLILQIVGELGKRAEPAVPKLVELFLDLTKESDLHSLETHRFNSENDKSKRFPIAPFRYDRRYCIETAIVKTLGDIGAGPTGADLIRDFNKMNPIIRKELVGNWGAGEDIFFRESAYQNGNMAAVYSAAENAFPKITHIPSAEPRRMMLNDFWNLNGRWRLKSSVPDFLMDPPDISNHLGTLDIWDRKMSLERSTLLSKASPFRRLELPLRVRGFSADIEITIDPTHSPRHMTLLAYKIEFDDSLHLVRFHGIYELTDTTLKMQFAKSGSTRPIAFTNNADQIPEDQMQVVFERVEVEP